MAKAHDGSDFKHRQRILPHYQVMALSKNRLKFIICLHYILAFLMAVKLLPTVLDLLNIFWQPIEELYIPMAKSWEWIWFSGLTFTFLALQSIRTNNSARLKLFLLGVTLSCILPLIYCAYLYSTDFRSYVITREVQKSVEVWRNYPVALYWYIFIGVALQVHGFELYFGWELLRSINNHRSSSHKSK